MKRNIFLFVCMLATACGGWTAAHAQSRLDLGAAAPALAGNSLDGGQVSLDSYRGRWVYLDFWASWCQPCVSSLPQVVALQKQLGGQGKLDVVSVTLDNQQTVDNLEYAIGRNGINYPVLYDGDTGNRTVAADWGVSTIPATFLINPQGLVAARDIDPSEIGSFVQLDGGAPYMPMQVRSQETLLRNSPSSGWPTMRDLKISLDIAPGSPPVSHYQLFVTAACQTGQGQSQYYDVRYDLNIQRGATDDSPYTVSISKTSGDSYVKRNDGPAGTQLSQKLPEMTVAIDTDNRTYEFIVPVPSCTVDLGYAIALYDERLGRYVRNGLTRVDTGVNTGGY